MRAHALIEAAVDPRRGTTRYPRLKSDPPLTLRATAGGVHLVGSAAGPLAGDDLRLDVVVRAGATLVVRSVAAMLAQPGVTERPSRLTVDVSVEAGATLHWLPRPMILVDGCDHETHTHIRLAAGAGLVWRDEVVFGRHGEAGGSVLQRLRVDLAGDALVRNDLVAGPRWPGSLGPAGVGSGAGAAGSFLLAGSTARGRADRPDGPDTASGRVDGVRLAALALDGDGLLCTAVAGTARSLGLAFDRLELAACASPAPVGLPA